MLAMPEISPATARRLRTMLSAMQIRTFAAQDIPEATRERIVNEIDAEGFGLIDELEGVVR